MRPYVRARGRLVNVISEKVPILTAHKITQDSWERFKSIHNLERTHAEGEQRRITSGCVQENESLHAKSLNLRALYYQEARERIKKYC